MAGADVWDWALAGILSYALIHFCSAFRFCQSSVSHRPWSCNTVRHMHSFVTQWITTGAVQITQSLDVAWSGLQSLLNQTRSWFSNGKWLIAKEAMTLLQNPRAFLSGFTIIDTPQAPRSARLFKYKLVFCVLRPGWQSSLHCTCTCCRIFICSNTTQNCLVDDSVIKSKKYAQMWYMRPLLFNDTHEIVPLSLQWAVCCASHFRKGVSASSRLHRGLETSLTSMWRTQPFCGVYLPFFGIYVF